MSNHAGFRVTVTVCCGVKGPVSNRQSGQEENIQESDLTHQTEVKLTIKVIDWRFNRHTHCQ